MWVNYTVVDVEFIYYNLCKRHITIKATRARAAGIERNQWVVPEMVERYGE
jgi:hypothetical protein